MLKSGSTLCIVGLIEAYPPGHEAHQQGQDGLEAAHGEHVVRNHGSEALVMHRDSHYLQRGSIWAIIGRSVYIYWHEPRESRFSGTPESWSAARGSNLKLECESYPNATKNATAEAGCQMRRRPFVAGIGHVDLAGLGRTSRDGAEAAMDCRYTALGTASAGNTTTGLPRLAALCLTPGSRERRMHAPGPGVRRVPALDISWILHTFKF